MLGSGYRECRPRSRPKHVRSRTDRARPAIRRVVLHRCVDHADLLSSHLSGQARQVTQRRVLPHRGRRRARGLPPVLAVPTGDGARDAGVERRGDDGLARDAAHRTRIPRRRRDRRGPRGHARHDGPTSAATVRAARRCLADCRRDDPAGTARESAGRRDRDADVRDRIRRGVRQHPTVQRRVSRGVSPVTDRGSPSAAQAWPRAGRRPGRSVVEAGAGQVACDTISSSILSPHTSRAGRSTEAIVSSREDGELTLKQYQRECARQGAICEP